MNRDEEIARKYLENLGFKDIVHEPDGKVPPDYLVNGHIAIEVRRLNQQIESVHGSIGIEQESIPFINSIQSLLEEIDTNHQSTWFASVTFKRPLQKWSQTASLIRQACEKISNIHAEPGESLEMRLSNELKIRFTKSSKLHDRNFLLGGVMDLDSGGFVIENLALAIDHCLKEKTRKIEKFRNKYSAWWLVLVDHISYCTSKDEMTEIDISQYAHNWQRILVISPVDPTKHFVFQAYQ